MAVARMAALVGDAGLGEGDLRAATAAMAAAAARARTAGSDCEGDCGGMIVWSPCELMGRGFT